ncbi:GlxA family transcriptional regulator [Sulfitobacter donghicola]|uniref:AraC family transcriptional regulator n=1 Tax=Sulfitobacter donghicola DSW-25 = KCTC 12864 = JCM 14565 TaxID=1300350 RepID=A0A073IFL4_9RHOB|nr:GlxA family transcriptional regulator [Sulfitobacter donghicola]KEJ88296.1 AraC family transcriptional regulator [Sulfitobacter donghicola DSW-25 = KCTC 12864 = JCM 14565]KIN68892.1 Transcriptional regulator [Sulfitobacter donghicola DSW-25 = KCTC 12864 = JCM 14565]
MDGSRHQEPEHFTFLLVENFSHLAFSCALEPLRIANHVAKQELYSWALASADGDYARASNGTETRVSKSYKDVGQTDYLFVLSGLGVQRAATAELLAAVRHARVHGARVGALCSAAYILAEAGMLDHQMAAIHWDFHDSFAEEFPQVGLSRSVFVPDAPVITASGGAATADLMLYLIRQKHGEDIATEVADQMVYNAVREGDAAQRVSLQSRHGIRNAHLARATQIMADNIDAPMPPSLIAREIGISGRQMERLFGRYLNCSPKKYYVDLRLQKAQRLLVQTDMSVTEIAFATGFNSPTHFSKTYRVQFGVSPSDQKNKID